MGVTDEPPTNGLQNQLTETYDPCHACRTLDCCRELSTGCIHESRRAGRAKAPPGDEQGRHGERHSGETE